MKALWSPVVYGRLFQVDEWWRALPDGTRADGWLADVVSAVVANGRDLTDGPRMLLARCPVEPGAAPAVLVGGACLVDLLDPFHSTDRVGRPLYGFVGWLGRPHEPGEIPGLDALREGFVRWAAPEYERAVLPDWNALTSPPWRGPSTPAAARWAAQRPGTDTHEQDLPSAAEGQGIWLLPERRAAAHWEAARRSPEPCVLVTGWRSEPIPARSALTHLCSTRIDAPELLSKAAAPPRQEEREQFSKEETRTGGAHRADTSSGWVRGALKAVNRRVPSRIRRWYGDEGGEADAPPAGAQQSASVVPDRPPLPPGPLAGREVVDADTLDQQDLFADLDEPPTTRGTAAPPTTQDETHATDDEPRDVQEGRDT